MAYPWPPFPARLTPFLGGHGGALPEELQLLLRAVSTHFRRRGLSLFTLSWTLFAPAPALSPEELQLLLWARLSCLALLQLCSLTLVMLMQRFQKHGLSAGWLGDLGRPLALRADGYGGRARA